MMKTSNSFSHNKSVKKHNTNLFDRMRYLNGGINSPEYFTGALEEQKDGSSLGL
ncbi:MAG: hypothetical protein LUD82_07700 [Clostridiales bacterium]|nr:hypothetical protein [Clostridiales bacterium]